MKIVQQTPSLLKLQRSNAYLVIVIIFFFVFLFYKKSIGTFQQTWQGSFPPSAEQIVLLLTVLLLISYSLLVSVVSFLIISNLFNKKFITSYTFDKSLETLKMEEQTLFSTKSDTWQLEEITSVNLEDKQFDRGRTYNLKLNLKSGSYIFIPLKIHNTKQANRIADSVSCFLNIKMC